MDKYWETKWNCAARFGICFLRVSLIYQPCCLVPCCQGKLGELKQLPTVHIFCLWYDFKQIFNWGPCTAKRVQIRHERKRRMETEGKRENTQSIRGDRGRLTTIRRSVRFQRNEGETIWVNLNCVTIYVVCLCGGLWYVVQAEVVLIQAYCCRL